MDENKTLQGESPPDALAAENQNGEEKASVMTVDEVRETLTWTEKGAVKQTLANCQKALQLDPTLGGKIRRNILTGVNDVVGDLPWNRNQSPALTDTDIYEIETHLEMVYELTSDQNIRRSIDVVANRNRYHPIRDYLESLTWDGVPRVRTLLPHFLGVEQNRVTEEVTLLMMKAALKRIYVPGCKFDRMICIVGDQGVGKSTFFRFLALKDEWFSDDLKKLEDENVYRKLQNHWIIEMSEMLATANAQSIEVIKSFLSRQKETYKIPYEKYPQDFPRQCIFAGTTNKMEFLPLDRSGNRRFITLRSDASKAELHPMSNEAESREYIRQAWAEMLTIYRGEKEHRLVLPADVETKLLEEQSEYTPEDSKAGMIRAWLDRKKDEKNPIICASMVYREALDMAGMPKHYESSEINDVIRHTPGWKSVSSFRFETYGVQRAWRYVGLPKEEEFHNMTEEEIRDMPTELARQFC